MSRADAWTFVGYGTCDGAGGKNGWLCQHRWTAISGMNGFRNQVGGAQLTGWTQGTNNQVAFSRGGVFRLSCSPIPLFHVVALRVYSY